MTGLLNTDALGAVLLALAVVSAFACGVLLWRAVDSALGARARREAALGGKPSMAGLGARGVVAGTDGPGPIGAAGSSAFDLEARVMGYARTLSRAICIGRCRRLAPAPFSLAVGRKAADTMRLAGIGEDVSNDGFCEASVRLALGLGVAGFVLGLVFSAALGALLLIAGLVVGATLPMSCASRMAKARASEMERHLPEMLDVVALGMRSGMSFDSSLLLYERHFDTPLSRELANLQSQWSSGLVFRDEALRSLASTYDSVVFGRVVETIIRSVRYGSSMVESLESDAAEARAAYQASREERAAKAPVKMMVPTGTLILPAMLILVLGPVLLELMDGGL